MDIINIFSALLTPVIAIATAIIAWRQWKTSHQKLTLDLYDRRLRIYQEVVKIFVTVVREADIKYEELAIFRASVAEADFVFGSEIVEYIDEIYRRGVNLHSWNEQYQDARQIEPTGYDHQKVVDGMHNELNWMLNQLDTVKAKFAKYMNLTR